MAFKNQYFIFFFATILCLISLSSPKHHHHHHHLRHHNHHHLRHHNHHKIPKILLPRSSVPPSPGTFQDLASSTSFGLNLPETTTFQPPNTPPKGKWTLLQKSIGISAMHMQLLHNNKVVIFDRTDFGASNVSLPSGSCRYNDEALPVDCTAHSILYDVVANVFRPLMVITDVWCSSGAVDPNGTLIQTGGYHAGDRKIRLFTPCDDEKCDWRELPQNLTVQRWYASNHILPDGRVIIVGGRRAFSYEFFPKKDNQSSEVFKLPFLKETNDPKEENNLYPFLYLLPDGNLYIFANQHSIILDFVKNKVVKEFPIIPGDKRTYPSTGSSVMLPLKLNATGENEGDGGPAVVEVMICGGAKGGSFIQSQKGIFMDASKTCGRMRVTDENPKWVMEEMPMDRVMPDLILLPNGHVLMLNGAAKGTAGWEAADDPVLDPVLYKPDEPDPSKRFTVLNPTDTPRMYHSSAILLTDGRILVGGSNPHVTYNFTAEKFPTDLSLEALSPPYLDPQYAHLRPSILSIEGNSDSESDISYGQKFSITFTVGMYILDLGLNVTMIPPSFTTHSFGMNQRLLVLNIVDIEQLSVFAHKVTVYAPPSTNVAPSGYYMIFVVHQDVPSFGVWLKIK